MSKLQARGEFIVALPGKKQNERRGILLPDSAQEDSPIAEVYAVGPDVKTVKVGDSILIPMLTQMRMIQTKYCDLFVDEKPAIVVKEEDVAVVWPKAAEGETTLQCGAKPGDVVYTDDGSRVHIGHATGMAED